MGKLLDAAKALQVTVGELRTYEDRKKQLELGQLKLPQGKEEGIKVCEEQIRRLRAKIEASSTMLYQGMSAPVQQVAVPRQQARPIIPKPLPTQNVQQVVVPVREAAPRPRPLPVQARPQEAPAPTPIPVPPTPTLIPVPPSPAPTPITVEAKTPIPPPSEFSAQRFRKLSRKEKEQYLKDISLSPAEVEDFIKVEKKKAKVKIEIKKEDYTIYKPNEWGATANKYTKKYADQLIKKYPDVFKPLFEQFQSVDMPILSHSYVSVMLFFSVLSLPTLLVTFVALNFVFKLNIVLVIMLAFAASIITLVGFYFYPASLVGDRRNKIKKDIPFALVHMSAVAGSGSHPISIFELLVESEEYEELKKEIRKILNYVNLFGYNLSTALRNVAGTTASQELKELLNGMVSTIETGGDLKGYLKGKAEDALNTYRLDRKREVEAISTYAEIYTALLIAAPLLLLVTLAIMNTIGGQLGGISVKLLAQISILAVLPVLNVGYMFFIKAQSANL